MWDGHMWERNSVSQADKSSYQEAYETPHTTHLVLNCENLWPAACAQPALWNQFWACGLSVPHVSPGAYIWLYFTLYELGKPTFLIQVTIDSRVVCVRCNFGSWLVCELDCKYDHCLDMKN